MNDPVDAERRLRAAFDDLRQETTSVPAGDALDQITGTGRRVPKWFAPAFGAAFAAALLIAGIVVLNDDTDKTVHTIAPPEKTTTSTAPTTTTPTEPPPLAVGNDGYFPWIYPDPILSSFEEGCPSAESTAKDYLGSVIGDLDPQMSVIDRSDQTVHLAVRARTEGGALEDRTSTMTVSRIDPGVVDCEAWGVVSVQAPASVIITSPEPNAAVGGSIEVAGQGQGFEANIGLRILDHRRDPIGNGSALGGATELGPFSATVRLDRTPTDPNLTVVATSSTGADKAFPPFAAVKVRYDGSASLPDPGPIVDPATVPYNFDYPVGDIQGPVTAVYPVRGGAYRGPHPGYPGEGAEVSVVDVKVGDWDEDGDLDALVLLREATINTTGKTVSLRLLRDLESSVHQSGVAAIPDDRPIVDDWGPTIVRVGNEVHPTVRLRWRRTVGLPSNWDGKDLPTYEGSSTIGPDGRLSEIKAVPS